MNLTSGQLTTLGSWITANQAANVAIGNITSIVNALNNTDPSNTAVYSPSIPSGTLVNAIVYGDFISLTVQQQNYFLLLLSAPAVDGTNPNVQIAIGTAFLGKTTLTNFSALARDATVFELLFTASHIVAPPLYGYQPSQTDIEAAIKGGY